MFKAFRVKWHPEKKKEGYTSASLHWYYLTPEYCYDDYHKRSPLDSICVRVSDNAFELGALARVLNGYAEDVDIYKYHNSVARQIKAGVPNIMLKHNGVGAPPSVIYKYTNQVFGRPALENECFAGGLHFCDVSSALTGW